MPAKSKHPAVLPKDSNLAKLLLSHILVMGISVLFREPDHQDHLSPTGAGSSHNHLYLLQFSQMQPVLTCDLYVQAYISLELFNTSYQYPKIIINKKNFFFLISINCCRLLFSWFIYPRPLLNGMILVYSHLTGCSTRSVEIFISFCLGKLYIKKLNK